MPRGVRSLEKPFGRALRRFRNSAGFSQEALAHRCGMHPTYLSQLERGLKSPSLRTIVSLAVALGREPHTLVKAAEEDSA
jgi:transcriptional regulator with XRE-family HTH domain